VVNTTYGPRGRPIETILKQERKSWRVVTIEEVNSIDPLSSNGTQYKSPASPTLHADGFVRASSIDITETDLPINYKIDGHNFGTRKMYDHYG
jgi:hypothetical protein